MKKFIFVVLAVFLFGAFLTPVAPAESKDYKTLDSGALDSLQVGTSAVYDTTLSIGLQGKDYLAFALDITVEASGGAGAGYIKFQGRVGTGTWVDIPIVDLSDSCAVVYNAAFSGTSSLSKYVIIGKVLPLGLDTADLVGIVATGGALSSSILWGDFMPFDKIRAIVADVNWSACATAEGTWIYW